MTKPFSLIDSQKLGEYYTFSEQVIEKTLTIAAESETAPENLPDSLVPTNSLLFLCLSYSIMYDKLLEYELATQPKINKLTH